MNVDTANADEDQTLSAKEAARYITNNYKPVSVAALALYRHRNRYPSLVPIVSKTGRIFYKKSVIDNFLKEQMAP